MNRFLSTIGYILILVIVSISSSNFLFSQIKNSSKKTKDDIQLYNYRDVKDSVILHYNLISMFDTNNINSSLRSINLNPDPANNSCVDHGILNPKLYLQLKLGLETYEFGDTYYSFSIRIVSTSRRSTGVFSTFIDTLQIQSNQLNIIYPEQLKIHSIKNDIDSGCTNFVIDNITPINGTSLGSPLSDSLVLVFFYTGDNIQKAVRTVNPLVALDSVYIPSGIQISPQGAVDFIWNVDNNCSADTLYPNHQFQLLKLFNIDESKNDPKDIKTKIDWSKALTVETGNSVTKLTLTLAEGDGYYIWRVRPIGNYYPGGIANDRNWGVWSTCLYNNINLNEDTTISVSDVTKFIGGFYNPNGFDLNINWIYKRNFTEGEEGTRISESIAYADNLLNVRQEQKYLPSKKERVANQTIYDYSGRPSLKTLPVPLNKDPLYQVQYKNKLASTNVNDSLYVARHFDENYNYKNPQQIDTASAKLFKYYSSNNTEELNIPSAKGYPYTRSIFAQDGTNRVVEQSGVGADHRIGGSILGKDRTLKTMYSSVADTEMVAVFGDEAPYKSSIYKIINIDQNKVASITYKSKSGEVLATCLNYTQGDTLLENLPIDGTDTKDTGITRVINDVISGKVKYGDNGFITSKKVSFTDESNTVTLNYKIIPNRIYLDNCFFNICTTCDYMVYLCVRYAESSSIVADSQDSVKISPKENCIPDTIIRDTKILTLPRGDYIFETKIIGKTKIHEDSVRTHISDFLKKANDTLRYKLNTILSWNEINGFIADENADLDSLYLYLNQNGWQLKNTDSSYYYWKYTECCDTIKIPYRTCKKCNCDYVNYENELTSRYKDSTVNGQLLGQDLINYFYRNGKKLYPATGAFTNGNGAFNSLITNMLNDQSCGNNTYDSCTICNCWKSIVESYWFMATKDSSGQRVWSYDFDLLDAFLNCAGKTYKGISNHPYGKSNSTYRLYGDGYLEYAYKFFQYDSLYYVESIQYRRNGCDACEEKLLSWNLNVLNSNGSIADTLFYGSGYVTDTCRYSNDTTKKKFERFYNCIKNAGKTDFSNFKHDSLKLLSCVVPYAKIDPRCIDSMKVKQEKNCLFACEDRFDGFVNDIIKMYHKAGRIVEGDVFDTCGVTINPNIQIDSMKNILCMARALVKHCQDSCHLDVTYDIINGTDTLAAHIGTSEQINRMQRAMFYSYELSIPENNACTDPNAVLIDSYEKFNGKEYAKNLAYYMNWTLKSILDPIGKYSKSYYDKFCKQRLDCEKLKQAYNLYMGLESDNNFCFLCFYPDTCIEPDPIISKKYSDLDKVKNNIMLAGAPSNDCLDDAIQNNNFGDFTQCPTAFDTSFDCRDTVYMSNFSLRPDLEYEFIIKDSCELYLKRTCSKNGTTVVDSFQVSQCTLCCPSLDWAGNSTCCTGKVCFKWVPFVIPESLRVSNIPISCERKVAGHLRKELERQFDNCVNSKLNQIEELYNNTCLNSAIINDSYKISYGLHYYHYTLYYYDRAGRLVRTIPPKGVSASPDTSRTRLSHPPHEFETYYRYNSLGQLIEQKSPDQESASLFYYNSMGQLRFSQDARQIAADKYSYTVYDNIGRIIETGEATNASEIPTLIASNGYPSNTELVLKTVYSTRVTPPVPYNTDIQRYLQNRISYTLRDPDGVLADSADQVRTYYSYDPHGNVEWVIQQVPTGSSETPFDIVSKTNYEYDLISGNVLKVKYNDGRLDKFFHKYSYDEDNRLVKVETSRDNEIWDRDASYDYYRHGPLKRIAIGEDSLQGIDYTYTIQGWLKGINHSSVRVANDPGKDGSTSLVHVHYPNDAFSSVLKYYNGDFINNNSVFNTFNHLPSLKPLFNGNISAWETGVSWAIRNLLTSAPNYYYPQINGNCYTYDVLNRLMSSTYRKFANPNWSFGNNYELNTSYSYDPNGNIMNLKRRSLATPFINPVGDTLDDLVYTYAQISSRKSNRLYSVTDLTRSRPGLGDIQFTGQSNVYGYDQSGNLISDPQEGISNIAWTADGKVKTITKTGPAVTIDFMYDARGDRVAKKVTSGAPNTLRAFTYYLRDANGEVMAIYDTTAEEGRFTPKLSEWLVYGSESHGRFETVKPFSQQLLITRDGLKFDDSLFTRRLRYREYELKDHLGNVRVTFSDLKLQPQPSIPPTDSFRLDLLSVNSYYPFGMREPERNWTKPGRATYRYMYNGKEQDRDIKGEGNSYDYGARFYDSRLGRWLSIDPKRDKLPGWSSYNYCRDNPILRIDPDGQFDAKWHQAMMSKNLKESKMNLGIIEENLIISEAFNVDLLKINDSRYHFDNLKNLRDINLNLSFLNSEISKVTSITKSNDRTTFADVAHARADFYSHSTYIELYIEYYNEHNSGQKLDINKIPTLNQTQNDQNFSGFKEFLEQNPDRLFTGSYSHDLIMRETNRNDPKAHFNINKDNSKSIEGQKIIPGTNSTLNEAAEAVATKDNKELIEQQRNENFFGEENNVNPKK